MSKITEYAEITSLDDDDWLLCVDVSDTSMAASGTTKKIKKSNLIAGAGITIQAIRVDTDGTKLWELGGTWGVAKGATGFYNITFPNAAADENSQAFAGLRARTDIPSSAHFVTVEQITATTCVVECNSSSGSASDQAFTLVRVLP